MRLTAYFANESDITFDEETQPLIRNKGIFHPPRNRNKTLDVVVDYLNNQNFDNAAIFCKYFCNKGSRKGWGNE